MINTQKKILCLCLVLIGCLSVKIYAQNAVKTSAENIEYFGKLETELVPDMRQLYRVVLKPFKGAANKFAFPIDKNIEISEGMIFDLRKSGGRFRVALLESEKKNAPNFCVDVNADTIFDKKECFQMTVSKLNQNDFEFTLNLPIKTALFNEFPFFFRYKRDYKSRDLQIGDRVLMQSLLAYAVGNVKLESRSVLVYYMVDSKDGTVSTTDSILGFDVDGDGKIENEPFSNEMSAATNEEIIFRTGDIFVSTSVVDTVNNKIVMRKRDRSEYRRIEIEVGKMMPEFNFIDFDNKKRTLFDFRGKYLLVDFWGVWCVDCRRQMPFQIEAYQKFRERGFEILGMDTDENLAQVTDYIKKSGINWTQAQYDSIRDLVKSQYRIQEFPSAVLLDADGKVLIIEQSLLKGDELIKTLDRILPKAK